MKKTKLLSLLLFVAATIHVNAAWMDLGLGELNSTNWGATVNRFKDFETTGHRALAADSTNHYFTMTTHQIVAGEDIRVSVEVTADRTTRDRTVSLYYVDSGDVTDPANHIEIVKSPTQTGAPVVLFDFSSADLASAVGRTVGVKYIGPETVTWDQVVSISAMHSAPAAILYVDSSKTDDNGDGLSWNTAKKTIAAATTLIRAEDGDQVWVKAGTYTASSTITVPADAGLYGGFAGTEANPSERTGVDGGYGWEFTNATIIDGAGSIGDRIISIASGVVDGVTVQNSNAGGVEIIAENSTIRNSIIRDNSRGLTGYDGQSAGISLGQGFHNFLVESCWVHNNEITSGNNESGAGIGLGVTVVTSSGLISGCWVTNNKASVSSNNSGGIGTGRHTIMDIVNCLVANNTGSNTASSASGIGHHESTSWRIVTVTNCTIVNNFGNAPAVRKVALKNSIVWGNVNAADSAANQIQLLRANTFNAIQDGEGTPAVTLNAVNDNAAGPNFWAPSAGVGYQATLGNFNWRLTADSVSLIDAGDDTAVAGIMTDITGGTRIIGSVVDIGAYEYDSSYTPAIGMTVSQEETELTWTVEEEIGVIEYQVVDAATGEVLEVIVAGEGSYSATLPEGIAAKLVVIDNSGFKQTFIPADGNVETVTYDLVEGWNLIAITGDNSDLSAIGTTWGWNGTAYEIVKYPQPTHAVWVYSNDTVQVDVTVEKSDAIIELVPGWNMVGPVENCKIPAVAHTVYGWNSIYELIANDQNTLVRGVGYWIFSL